MPHYCRICDSHRSNEKFSGRGHRDHICKECQRLPPDERDHIERMDELCGFLEQSNISAKNIARSKILTQHASSEVSHLAALVLDIARVKPHKRRRWKFLAHNHFDLFVRLKKFWICPSHSKVSRLRLWNATQMGDRCASLNRMSRNRRPNDREAASNRRSQIRTSFSAVRGPPS